MDLSAKPVYHARQHSTYHWKPLTRLKYFFQFMGPEWYVLSKLISLVLDNFNTSSRHTFSSEFLLLVAWDVSDVSFEGNYSIEYLVVCDRQNACFEGVASISVS